MKNKIIILLISLSLFTNCKEGERKREFMLNTTTKVVIEEDGAISISDLKNSNSAIKLFYTDSIFNVTVGGDTSNQKLYTFNNDGLVLAGNIQNGKPFGKFNSYEYGMDVKVVQWFTNSWDSYYWQVINNDNSIGSGDNAFVFENLDTSKLIAPIIKPIIYESEESYIEFRLTSFPFELVKYTFNGVVIKKSNYNGYKNIFYAYLDKKDIGKKATIITEYMNPKYETIKYFETTIELK